MTVIGRPGYWLEKIPSGHYFITSSTKEVVSGGGINAKLVH